MPPHRMPAKHNPFESANLIDNVRATIGQQAGHTINVLVEMLDPDGSRIESRGTVLGYVSDDPTGQGITSKAGSVVLSAGDHGFLIGTNHLVTDADGCIDINIVYDQPWTFYLAFVLPSGKVIPSSPITFV